MIRITCACCLVSIIRIKDLTLFIAQLFLHQTHISLRYRMWLPIPNISNTTKSSVSSTFETLITLVLSSFNSSSIIFPTHLKLPFVRPVLYIHPVHSHHSQNPDFCSIFLSSSFSMNVCLIIHSGAKLKNNQVVILDLTVRESSFIFAPVSSGVVEAHFYKCRNALVYIILKLA